MGRRPRNASREHRTVTAVEVAARYRWIALALAFSSQVSNGLSSQAVAPLAPLFQPELGLTKAEVGFFSSAAYAGAWGLLLVSGSLTDRFGARTMMSLGQVVAGLFMFAMATVGGFFQAMVVMLAVGIGRAMAAPSLTKTIMDFFPPSSRATAMGAKQAAVPLAGIMTASTLPSIALIAGWRWAVAAAGFWILASGLATAILYPSRGRREASAQRKVSALAALGSALRNRGLWSISVISVLFVTVQLATTSYLALYFEEIVLVPMVPDEDTRIVAAGGYLAICQAGGVVGRVVWGAVSDRLFHGRRLPVLAIVGVLGALASWTTGSLASGYPIWVLTAVALALGASSIAWNGLYQALIVETTGRKYAGTGVGLSMTMTQIGTVGGPPLFGYIVDVTGSYRTAWTFLAMLSGMGALAAGLGATRERHVE